jgi:hypothetical protein
MVVAWPGFESDTSGFVFSPDTVLSNWRTRMPGRTRGWTAFYIIAMGWMIRRWIIHRPDDGGSKHVRNVCQLRDCTARYPRRLSSSYSPPWESEMSHRQNSSDTIFPETTQIIKFSWFTRRNPEGALCCSWEPNVDEWWKRFLLFLNVTCMLSFHSHFSVLIRFVTWCIAVHTLTTPDTVHCAIGLLHVTAVWPVT